MFPTTAEPVRRLLQAIESGTLTMRGGPSIYALCLCTALLFSAPLDRLLAADAVAPTSPVLEQLPVMLRNLSSSPGPGRRADLPIRELSLVKRDVDDFCQRNDVDFAECDRLRSVAVRRSAEASVDHVLASSPLPPPWLRSWLPNYAALVLEELSAAERDLEDQQQAYSRLEARYQNEVDDLKRELVLSRTSAGRSSGYSTSNPGVPRADAPERAAVEEGRGHRDAWVWDARVRPMVRVAANDPDLRRKYVDCARRGEPLIITGLTLPQWDLDRLRRTCGESHVLLKRLVRGSAAWAQLKAASRTRLDLFLDHLDRNSSSDGGGGGRLYMREMYMHDMSVREFCPQLLETLTMPWVFGEDLLQRVPGRVHRKWTQFRDYWPSVFVGGDGTSSGLHSDWADTSAWMGVVGGGGHKEWRISPRSNQPLLYRGKGVNRFDGDLFAPDLQKHPANGRAGYWHGEQRQGDTIFIPSGCAHQVINRGTTVAVAFNFVDMPIADRFEAALLELAASAGGSERHYYLAIASAFAEVVPAHDRGSRDDVKGSAGVENLPWCMFKQDPQCSFRGPSGPAGGGGPAGGPAGGDM